MAAASAATPLFDFWGFKARKVFFLEIFAMPLMTGISWDLGFYEFFDIAEEIVRAHEETPA